MGTIAYLHAAPIEHGGRYEKSHETSGFRYSVEYLCRMTDPLLDLSLAVAHCKSVAIAHGPLLLSMFLAGLIGSASHCAAMCGPFVLVQTSETMARLKVGSGELRRLAGAALLPYHAGRAITYILLAVLLSLPLKLMAQLPQLRFIPAVALALGALLFLVLGFRGLRGSLESGIAGVGLGAWLGRVTKPLFARPWGWHGLGLGVLLGFLPCGLLYAAIGAAAATSDPLAAAMSMAAFTLGTFPMLWLVGYLGGWAQRRWHKMARPVMPVVALLNAMVLGGMAWSWIASA
jgi:hypothetical protein